MDFEYWFKNICEVTEHKEEFKKCWEEAEKNASKRSSWVNAYKSKKYTLKEIENTFSGISLNSYLKKEIIKQFLLNLPNKK